MSVQFIKFPYKGGAAYEKYRMWIDTELWKACSEYPNWPDDLIYSLAIFAEEAGEAVRAANEVLFHGASFDSLREELAQAGAMVIRCMEYIDYLEARKKEQS